MNDSPLSKRLSVLFCYLPRHVPSHSAHACPACLLPCDEGASIKYVRKIFGFLDPLPPCPHFCKTVCPQNRPIFGPPPPLGADVLNGSPLMHPSDVRGKAPLGHLQVRHQAGESYQARSDRLVVLFCIPASCIAFACFVEKRAQQFSKTEK